jgi:hypothetical protein
MKNQFIKGLRSENIRNQIRMEDNANRTLEDVKGVLRKYENKFSNLVEKPVFSPSLTSNVSRSRDNSANRVSFDQKKCDYCHRNNHSESECRTKIRDLERSAPSNQPPNQPQYQQQSNKQQGQTQYQQPSQPQYQQPNQQQYQQPSQQYNQHPNQNAPQMANFNGRNVNGSFCSAKQVETEIYFKSNNSTDPSIKKLIDEIGGVCLIDGKEVNFMADTGCTLTVVDKRVIADQNGVIANMEPSPYTCIIADGQPTAIMGQKRVKITVGNNKSTYHNVLISPHLAKDCLLGLDVLESCPLTKDLLQELRTRLNGTKKDKKSISSIFKNMIMFLSVGLLLNPILLNVATAVHETQTKIINKLNTIANDIIYALESIAALSPRLNSRNQGFESLGRTNVLSHFIEIKPGTEPIRQKMRKVPQAFENQFKTTIHEMIKHGLIRASRSPWSSPVRLVRKKDGSMRITVDYRKLNGVTIKDAYPIPNINNMFNHLTKGRLFTTLDLHSGYFQLPMDPVSSQYTAFTCEFGFFEYVVMPQGLCNATATFQRAMTLALGDLIGKICYCYLDDVIIFSEDPDQHLEHVKMVRDRLKQHNLKIKMSKCKFAQTKIEYLSHVICNGHIYPSPLKTEAVHRTIIPKSVKQIQSFLGLCSYYRRFIRNFSTIASPLIRCTEKGKAFEWNSDCQKAFDQLKSIITSDQVLLLPDFDKPFRIDTDASLTGVGAVLSQEKEDGSWRPVAFFSKHLTKRQQNYSTSERELLSIVLAIEHFKQFIYGRPVTVYTDHQTLKYLLTVDEPAQRLARWLDQLRMFDLTIEYRKGTANANANALSRMTDASELKHDISSELNPVLINAIHIQNNLLSSTQMEDPDLKWFHALKLNHTDQPPTIDKKDELNDERRSLFAQWNRIRVSGQNLFREYTDSELNIKFQYIVPKGQRRTILEAAHDNIWSGHLGYDKTLHRVIPKFYWQSHLGSCKNMPKLSRN